ncbi:MAG TPA: maleylpyruvate isomerase N-terminal domain-containing protein, partial [Actinomycetes bacterium]|nr:maleylpyruvate isomerase N-terminal domain-containing protein [Actinomycetes bacterium]
MREIDYLQALRDEGTALVAAARLGLDPPVPACPGWAVADLVLHTGMVHRH